MDNILNMALMNPVVLDCIFSHSDLSALKEIRNVCSLWRDIGAIGLGHVTVLDVRKILPCYTYLLKPPLFSVNLAKNIKILTCEDEFGIEYVRETKLEIAQYLQIFQFIDEVVENIHINSEINKIPHFVDKMNEFKFPKLKSLSLTGCVKYFSSHYCDDHDKHAVPILPCPDWRLRMTVKFVKLDTCGFSRLEYAPILQSVLKSCPNMEHLSVKGNLYPDLSKAVNLKRLEYDSSYSLDLLQVKRTLTSGQNTIVDLSLDWTAEFAENETYDDFCLPTMPNLIKLTVLNCDMYRLQGSLNMVKLPKLTHLSISSRSQVYTAHDFWIGLCQRHSGIVSLNIVAQAGSDLVRQVAEHFPMVKKLSVEVEPINCYFTKEEWKEELLSENFMEFYQAWKNLETNMITIGGIMSIDTAELCLEILSTCEGGKRLLKKFEISFTLAEFAGPRSLTFTAAEGQVSVIESFTTTLKTTFLLCANFKRVRIVGFKMVSTELAGEIDDYIKEHNLPIYF